MSRVFLSTATGATIYVFANDHCPPHVRARHRGDDWVARAAFSFLDRDVALMSVTPARNTPARRTIGLLLAEIEANVPDCRAVWWAINGTVCLSNQWATVSRSGRIGLAAPRAAGAKQIRDARYDDGRLALHVTFRDGTTVEQEMDR